MKEELWGVCKVSGEPTLDVIEKGSGVAPCRDACPVGIDVPRYIRLIRQGKFIDALEVITDKIPFPSIVAHVCPRFCETKCRRAEVDMPVAINALKRFVADTDLAAKKPYLPVCREKTGKKVAIIGAGPAGLASAYYLQQEGHDCFIFDDQTEPGGLLRYGIPDEKLDKEVLDAEIAVIRKV